MSDGGVETGLTSPADRRVLLMPSARFMQQFRVYFSLLVILVLVILKTIHRDRNECSH